jgi:integrase/recombinase XerC
LVRVASRLKPVDPLRPLTYSKLFGLLAATGMRRSEAMNLLDDDVGPDGQRLVIRLTKFRKSRQLPLYPSTASALLTYRGQRNQQWPRTPARPFFVGHTGMPLPGPTLHSVFTGLRRSLGWRARGDHPKRRIHDLRHTFALRCVQRWYEEGVPIEQAMFCLCTYLGHGKITDTYWYLTGVPELIAVAGHCFEAFATEPELCS